MEEGARELGLARLGTVRWATDTPTGTTAARDPRRVVNSEAGRRHPEVPGVLTWGRRPHCLAA